MPYNIVIYVMSYFRILFKEKKNYGALIQEERRSELVFSDSENKDQCGLISARIGTVVRFVPYQVRWPTVPGTSDFRTKYGASAPHISRNRTLVRGTIRILPDIVLNIPVPNTRTGFLPWYGVN